MNKQGFFKTIKFRLSAIFCGIAIAISVFTSMALYEYQKECLINLLGDNASILVQNLAINAAPFLLDGDKMQLSILISTELKNPEVISVGILDDEGTAIMHSDINEIGNTILTKEVVDGKQMDLFSDNLLKSKPILVNGERIGSAILEMSTSSVFTQIKNFKLKLFSGLLIFSLLACVLTFYIIGCFLKPLNILSKAATQVGQGDLNVHILEKGGGEIQSLGRVLNQMIQKLSMANHRIEEGYLQSVMALAAAVEAKDPYTRGHCDRVAYYAVQIARQMGMDEVDIKKLQLAGQLHDLGKIGVDEHVLCKPDRLTVDEFDHISRHPMIAWHILEPAKFLSDIRDIIVVHHERYDGNGYPYGLSEDEICMTGKVLALADCYDAMTSNRPYRKHLSEEKALKIIEKEKNKQFDPKVVKAFFDAHKSFESRDLLDERLKISSRGRVWAYRKLHSEESPKRNLTILKERVA